MTLATMLLGILVVLLVRSAVSLVALRFGKQSGRRNGVC
jgi:hypothetical protein